MWKCDICGAQFGENEYSCGRFTIEKCDLCGRHVCEKCTYNTTFSPINRRLLINTICKDCAKIGKKYISRISNLNRECSRKEIKIIGEWKEEVNKKGEDV